MLPILLFVLLGLTKAEENNEACKKKLMGPVIPRYANSTIDTVALRVVFKGRKEVKCGNYLGFLTTLLPPTVSYDVQDRCENVTILFIGIPTKIYDTDAFVGYPYRHWLVLNVPAEELKKGFNGIKDFNVGDTKTKYLPPINPFSDHLYTFLVYCQKEYINPGKMENGLLFQRPSFAVKKFAATYNLGNPIAINYLVSSLLNDKPIPPAEPEGAFNGIFDLPTAKGSGLGK